MKNLRLLVFVPSIVFLAVFLDGCGVSQSYYKSIDTHLKRYEFDKASLKVDKSEYGSRNRLLYYMDLGILQHYEGRFEASNASLIKAGDVAEELFTKSVSQRIMAYTTNDNIRDYPGEDFEVALIDLFRAVNYLMLGNLENALVMCRSVDNRLKVFHDYYEYENAKQKEAGERISVTYTEDAFIRYLMGLLFEADGDLNNAFVSYRHAISIYDDYQKYYRTRLPSTLPTDLLSVIRKMGLDEEYDQYKRRFSGAEAVDDADLAHLIVLFYNGLSPVKKELVIDINVNNRNAPAVEVAVPGYSPTNLDPMGIRLALPIYEKRDPYVRSSDVILNGTTNYRQQTEIAEDISEIAIRNLKDRYPAIRRRALVRTIIKTVASMAIDHQAQKKLGTMGMLIGAATKITAKYSEQADLRCWRTLPAQIQITRMRVKPGNYSLSVGLSSGWTKNLGSVALKPGQFKFVTYQSIY